MPLPLDTDKIRHLGRACSWSCMASSRATTPISVSSIWTAGPRRTTWYSAQALGTLYAHISSTLVAEVWLLLSDDGPVLPQSYSYHVLLTSYSIKRSDYYYYEVPQLTIQLRTTYLESPGWLARPLDFVTDIRLTGTVPGEHSQQRLSKGKDLPSDLISISDSVAFQGLVTGTRSNDYPVHSTEYSYRTE